jgi:hypothetical protein
MDFTRLKTGPAISFPSVARGALGTSSLAPLRLRLLSRARKQAVFNFYRHAPL